MKSSRKIDSAVSLQLPPNKILRETFLPLETLVARCGLSRQTLEELFENGTVEAAFIDGSWYAQESKLRRRALNQSGGGASGMSYPQVAKPHGS